MKCRKCNHELKADEKFCPNCGTKVTKQSSFQQKMDAENKANEHQKKMAEKEIERQNKIIKEKGLKNNDVYIAFALGIIGLAFTLWPAGHITQLQWWYVAATILSGALGYYFALRANKVNKAYHQRYRVIVHPKMMKASIYMAAITCFAGTILLISAIIYYSGGL